jgi:ribosome maturation factor RimP
MSKISSMVEEIARPVAEQCGCSLWDVEYLREAGSWYLRVYIDKPDGVSIQDCEQISKLLDPVLDEKDFIQNSYIFEVCSAGADRVLKKPGDFPPFFGRSVDIRLYKPLAGSKAFTGILKDYTDSGITLLINNAELSFAHENIAQVRLHVDF